MILIDLAETIKKATELILNKANGVFYEVLLVSLKCRFVLAEHEIKSYRGCIWEISRSIHIFMLNLSFFGGTFCIYNTMDVVWGERSSPAFLGMVRSVLKDCFIFANFFLDLLFRQATWKVCLFNIYGFKREKLGFTGHSTGLNAFGFQFWKYSWIPVIGSDQPTFCKYFIQEGMLMFYVTCIK